MLHFVFLVFAVALCIRQLPFLAKSCLHIVIHPVIIAIAMAMLGK